MPNLTNKQDSNTPYDKQGDLFVIKLMGKPIAWIGTKQQLQSAGFGVGLQFPGEPGAPPRAFTVLHKDGLRVQIQTHGNGVWMVGKRPDKPSKGLAAARKDKQFQCMLERVIAGLQS